VTTPQIRIYTTDDGEVSLEVAQDAESLWLTQAQMAELFGTRRPAITKHLGNIFKSGELDEPVVCSILEHATQHGALAGKTQTSRVKYYNLDAIISVGYRVNSGRATQFRIWATHILKQYLVDGYTLNRRRLQQRGIEFEQAVNLLSRTLANQQLVDEQGQAVIRVIQDYARSWSLLQGYDEQKLAEIRVYARRSPGWRRRCCSLAKKIRCRCFLPRYELRRCTKRRRNWPSGRCRKTQAAVVGARRGAHRGGCR